MASHWGLVLAASLLYFLHHYAAPFLPLLAAHLITCMSGMASELHRCSVSYITEPHSCLCWLRTSSHVWGLAWEGIRAASLLCFLHHYSAPFLPLFLRLLPVAHKLGKHIDLACAL